MGYYIYLFSFLLAFCVIYVLVKLILKFIHKKQLSEAIYFCHQLYRKYPEEIENTLSSFLVFENLSNEDNIESKISHFNLMQANFLRKREPFLRILDISPKGNVPRYFPYVEQRYEPYSGLHTSIKSVLHYYIFDTKIIRPLKELGKFVYVRFVDYTFKSDVLLLAETAKDTDRYYNASLFLPKNRGLIIGKYQEIEIIDEESVIVKNDNQFGFVDLKNQNISRIQYQSIEPININKERYYIVQKDYKFGIVNQYELEEWPFVFDSIKINCKFGLITFVINSHSFAFDVRKKRNCLLPEGSMDVVYVAEGIWTILRKDGVMYYDVKQKKPLSEHIYTGATEFEYGFAISKNIMLNSLGQEIDLGKKFRKWGKLIYRLESEVFSEIVQLCVYDVNLSPLFSKKYNISRSMIYTEPILDDDYLKIHIQHLKYEIDNYYYLDMMGNEIDETVIEDKLKNYDSPLLLVQSRENLKSAHKLAVKELDNQNKRTSYTIDEDKIYKWQPVL